MALDDGVTPPQASHVVPAAGDREAASWSSNDNLLLLVIGVVGAVALGVLVRIHAPWWAIAVEHVLLVAALAALLRRTAQARRDTAMPILALLTGILAGPLGPLGAAMIGFFVRPVDVSNPLIEQWYVRISMATAIEPDVRLCDDVRVGRTLDPAEAVPQSFPVLMASGPLSKRQAILGFIARHYHSDYLPTLKIALESQEPTLRVQAAAVAAHIAPMVRENLTRALKGANADGLEVVQLLDLDNELMKLASSGLIDESERMAAGRARGALAEKLLDAIRNGRHLALARHEFEAPLERGETLERFLVSHRLFPKLRSWRVAQAIRRTRPNARFRCLIHARKSQEALS
ncbi:MAG: hypothetical protein ACK5JT_15385 [Hyphomicrobiaceae bacterium]